MYLSTPLRLKIPCDASQHAMYTLNVVLFPPCTNLTKSVELLLAQVDTIRQVKTGQCTIIYALQRDLDLVHVGTRKIAPVPSDQDLLDENDLKIGSVRLKLIGSRSRANTDTK